MKEDDFELILRYQKEIFMLSYASALLSWDQQTYMPSAGVQSKSEQGAYISSLIHNKSVSPELFSALKRLKKKKLSGDKKLMVDKLYKDIEKSRKIPKELVEELSKETALGNDAWMKAREKKNFDIFRPHLEKIVKLKQEYAKRIGMPGHVYNSLLDGFEEGMTVEKLKPIFNNLKFGLLELLRKIESSEKYKKQKKIMMKQGFDKDNLLHYVKDVASRMGLDKKRSRIDLSEHPFTTKIGANDVRLTTNFRENPMFSFGSTVHEAGHALYELNMPVKNAYDILGGSPSMGLHESQSRFWENNIGKSKAFWRFYFPKFKKDFKLKGDFNEWYSEDNFIEKGMVRVEADEVHYCLHIILRFELELGLMDGSVKVKDLPKLWNSKMLELFGKKPGDDVSGVLQDIHWSWGEFGYFPTYAIGTMYAAQLYETLKKNYRNLDKDVSKGNFEKIGKWLNENIHKHGNRDLAENYIKKITGEGLNPEVYLKYLNDKYREIYNF